MTPIHTQVYIKYLPTEQVTGSGLTANSKLRKAEVVAVGTGRYQDPMLVKKGDTVLVEEGVGVQWVEGEISGIFITQDKIISIL